jgi:hypothetical protein
MRGKETWDKCAIGYMQLDKCHWANEMGKKDVLSRLMNKTFMPYESYIYKCKCIGISFDNPLAPQNAKYETGIICREKYVKTSTEWMAQIWSRKDGTKK